MKLGIHFMNFGAAAADAEAANTAANAMAHTIAQTAKTADDVGAAWFTFMDHYFQMEHVGGPAAPMLEGYTSLGFVAGQTRNLRLGLLVTGVTYRHPGLLAKMVSTLDVLSNGRATLGLGAAWYDREHHGLGVPFPAVSERFERLEETIQVVKQMWSTDNGPYAGQHYQLAETINVPQPLNPSPPILIGGAGEKKTLKLVAKYADACNLFAFGTDMVQAKLNVLASHCDAEGRDYSTIQKTILGVFTTPNPVTDTDNFLAEMERYAALGIDHIQVAPPAVDPAGFVAELGERVIPRLAEISA